MQHNRVKNSRIQEANQLATYKHGRGFDLGTTENKSSCGLAVRAGLELAPLNCKFIALTSRPRSAIGNSAFSSSHSGFFSWGYFRKGFNVTDVGVYKKLWMSVLVYS